MASRLKGELSWGAPVSVASRGKGELSCERMHRFVFGNAKIEVLERDFGEYNVQARDFTALKWMLKRLWVWEFVILSVTS